MPEVGDQVTYKGVQHIVKRLKGPDHSIIQEDGVEILEKTVANDLLTILSEEAEILTFSFAEQSGPATIDSGAATIDIEVVALTDPSALVPTITVSTGATVDPASGVVQDYSSPFVHTVTAEDGITQKAWTVTVTVAV